MPYKRFTVWVIVRVLLLAATIFLISWIFGDERLFFNQIILFIVFAFQLTELVRFVNHTNYELARFFLAVRHADFSVSFKQPSLGRSFDELQQSMTEVIDAYKQVKIEKEAQYHFLQLLINQLQVGVVSLHGDYVSLINPAAEHLLQINGLKSWKIIAQLNPALSQEVELLGSHGRKLVEVRTGNDVRILSVDVRSLVILGEPHKLITLQDLNSEIEQKEFEAWHKLIRILTHEIMNSVTPIASLTETMQGMLTSREHQPKPAATLSDETVADLLFSLNTIHKRSEGLLHFVENYRRLTRVPKPVLETVPVHTFFRTIEKLLHQTLAQHNIALTITADPTLTATLDVNLMEQVILNLIANSTHALEHTEVKSISLLAYPRERQVVLEVTDNGKGIPAKELQQIFVPFFSTKKEGSGIGLSLSKQIVSLHGGSIKVTSTPGQGTSFFITLNTPGK